MEKITTQVAIFVACGVVGLYSGNQKEFAAIFYAIFIVIHYRKWFLIKEIRFLLSLGSLIVYPLILNILGYIRNSELKIILSEFWILKFGFYI